MAKQLYTENVWTFLLKQFSFGRMRRELQSLEKYDSDPDVADTLAKLQSDTDELEVELQRMARLCADQPDHPLCKDHIGKSKVTGIED